VTFQVEVPSVRPKAFQVSIQVTADIPVDAVKGLVVNTLKSSRPNLFGKMDIDVDWLILYSDDSRNIEIEQMMPPRKELWATITIPRGLSCIFLWPCL
jgi:hypothetical protein